MHTFFYKLWQTSEQSPDHALREVNKVKTSNFKVTLPLHKSKQFVRGHYSRLSRDYKTKVK